MKQTALTPAWTATTGIHGDDNFRRHQARMQREMPAYGDSRPGPAPAAALHSDCDPNPAFTLKRSRRQGRTRLVLDVAVGRGRSRPRLPGGDSRRPASPGAALLAGVGAVGGFVTHLAAVEAPCGAAVATTVTTHRTTIC